MRRDLLLKACDDADKLGYFPVVVTTPLDVHEIAPPEAVEKTISVGAGVDYCTILFRAENGSIYEASVSDQKGVVTTLD